MFPARSQFHMEAVARSVAISSLLFLTHLDLGVAPVEVASVVAQMVKNLPSIQETQVRSLGGSGRSPGERNGNPLQYSCLENSMDRGTWWVIVHGVA